MARAGAGYPQVEPTAAALMDRRVVECPPGRRVGSALLAARRAGAVALALGKRRAVTRRELERASDWGLGGLRASVVAREGLAVVSATAPEVAARRLLIAGAPMALVRDGRRVVGVIDAEAVEIARPALSLVHRLDRAGSPLAEARLWLLRVAGKVSEGLGTPVFAVGGFVRDLLLDRAGPDVDLVVEGDGMAFARQLREEIGGRLVTHEEFATASIDGAAAPTGPPLGRIDIASARRERYEAPGALPMVRPTTVDEDLRRRDFAANALAVALQPSAFGRLLDLVGGRLDVRRRVLRPLHPLSFVEDPTRIFRAARYACRLGFRLDGDGLRALALALRVGPYPALSGRRLKVEIDLIASEPRGWRGFELLLTWKALRIWDNAYRRSVAGKDRVRAAGRFWLWAKRAEVALNPGELALIALLSDQRAPVVARCLTRLALSGEPARRLYAAATAGPLARRLDGASWRRPSEVAEALDSCPVQVLAGAWLRGGPRARRRIKWFLGHARAVRPLLSGDDVVSLGVPRGPEVGKCLAALRRVRLDGAVRTRLDERAFVQAWRPEDGHRLVRRQTRGEGSRQRGGRGRGAAVASATRHVRTRGEV